MVNVLELDSHLVCSAVSGRAKTILEVPRVNQEVASDVNSVHTKGKSVPYHPRTRNSINQEHYETLYRRNLNLRLSYF